MPSPSEPTGRPEGPLPLVYGPHPDQVADLHLPDREGTDPVPLVLFFHGGFWRATHDRQHAARFAGALAQACDCAVANIEYRRVGAGGGWPTTLTDAARAVDRLPELASRAAPGRIDGGRVVYAGHSAGGHLALWAATRHRLPADAPGRTDAPAPIRGVLALAPTADLAHADRLGSGRGAVADFLGGSSTEVPERYAAADPAVLGAPAGHTVVVHGTHDEALPPDMARAYTRTTGTALVEIPHGSHFDVIDPDSTAWPHITQALGALAGTRG
ncbi:alpha/beta hydrolase [Streptomyces sp. NPDC097704]|uniref:alpha/beta hydrolase n=1 Tax=Streptomyces sp. NPDC097704 TaxID=3157101 RepID=UPI003322278D